MSLRIAASLALVACWASLASPASAADGAADPDAAAADAGDDADVDFVDLDAPETLPLPKGDDIYLRVDGAYRLHGGTDASLSGVGALSDDDLDDGWGLGAGVGYRLGDMLRLDLTVDYGFASEFSGDLGCPGCGPVSADVQSVTGLVNAYADLGDWKGFSPYVGAGIGAAWLDTSDVSGPAQAGGDDSWNLAWALSAGIGYKLSDAVTLDVGYRYLDLGEAEATVGGADADFDVSAHEIRVGLRFALN